jgi:hypothetical protein
VAPALAVRDTWIGWDASARRANLARVVNNSRFLIFPYVQVPHLASHVLGQLARQVPPDWQHHWDFTPLLLETFVDSQRICSWRFASARAIWPLRFHRWAVMLQGCRERAWCPQMFRSLDVPAASPDNGRLSPDACRCKILTPR